MKELRKYVFYTLSSEEDIDNIRYIGVTCRNLKARLSQHKYTAKNPDKRTTPVSKWIYKLQKQNVNIVIKQIDECLEDTWEDKEIELIAAYKNKFKLLNVDEGGKGVITIEKRNKSGLKRSAEAHEIPIVQLDLKGEYIKTFKSIMAATKEMGLSSKSAISNVLNGRSKTSCGFYWVYEKDFIKNNYTLSKRVSPKESKGIKHYQYCPDTYKLIKVYLSQREVLYEIFGMNSNATSLIKAIKNKTCWHDYFWTTEETFNFDDFFDNRYKILEIDNDSKIIRKFKSNKEAAFYFKKGESTISNYIRNKTKTKNNTYLIKNNK